MSPRTPRPVYAPWPAARTRFRTTLSVIITDPAGARSYPIVTDPWALRRTGNGEDPAKTKAVEALIRWSLADG